MSPSRTELQKLIDDFGVACQRRHFGEWNAALTALLSYVTSLESKIAAQDSEIELLHHQIIEMGSAYERLLAETI